MDTTATPAPMQLLSPAAAATRTHAGTLTVVDVRPPQERALATVTVAHRGLEDGGLEQLLALPKDQPLAFLCHHGARSAQAGEYFRAHGFAEVYNVVGGIDAWSLHVDPSIPRY